MGTWGPGNFDDDTAADGLSIIVGELTEKLREEFEGTTNLEPDEWGGPMVPAWLEILVLFKEQEWVGSDLPPSSTIAEWKRTYLEVWDGYIDELEPAPDYKRDRRAVLEKTFDRAIALSTEIRPS